MGKRVSCRHSFISKEMGLGKNNPTGPKSEEEIKSIVNLSADGTTSPKNLAHS